MEHNQKNVEIDQDKTVVAGIGKTSSHNESDLIGMCFNERYLIESQIGSGGMSDIYRAKDLNLEAAGVNEPYVAIKVLLSQYASMPDIRKVLLKEARKTQQLSHPNIIRVYDVDSYKDYYFMVMEWLDGESLDQVIKRSKPAGVPFKGAKSIINQIGSALECAHSAGIVHTDLKPSNIFLTRQGHIKIFDFGVARTHHLNTDEFALPANDVTSPLAGYTPAYASKEQLNGQEPCFSDDIYSFSCICYELLTSKHPYDRASANTKDAQNITLSKPRGINMIQWSVLKKGLSLAKKTRYQDVKLMLDGFNKRILPSVIIGSVVIIAGTLGAKFYMSQTHNVEQLNQVLASSNEQISSIKAFANIDYKQALKLTTSSIPLEQTIVNGVLRRDRHKVIDMFEIRMLEVPKGRNGTYKNYLMMQQQIMEAKLLFPDSLRLRQLELAQENSRQSHIDALAERLDLLLSQRRYQEPGRNNIKDILADLAFIAPSFKFVPATSAYQAYSAAFDQALLTHNVDMITSLIDVGEVAFFNHKLAVPYLAKGKQLKKAVVDLANYRRDLENGDRVEYPTKAAKTFYRNVFDTIGTKISEVNKYEGLMKTDGELKDLVASYNLPHDFELLVTAQRKMAALYLHYANEQMNVKRFKTAQMLVKRGNAIYEKINGNSAP